MRRDHDLLILRISRNVSCGGDVTEEKRPHLEAVYRHKLPKPLVRLAQNARHRRIGLKGTLLDPSGDIAVAHLSRFPDRVDRRIGRSHPWIDEYPPIAFEHPSDAFDTRGNSYTENNKRVGHDLVFEAYFDDLPLRNGFIHDLFFEQNLDSGIGCFIDAFHQRRRFGAQRFVVEIVSP